MVERPREGAAPVGKIDTCGRVAAEPCPAALEAYADAQSSTARMHHAHELGYRRHAATPDAGTKRCRYESCRCP